MTYLESCNKYFAPLDEIQEALDNEEGLKGIDYEELLRIVSFNKELVKDLEEFSD